MKIEKLNDNQIRCTLTREDLISRRINLRELVYGSDKARKLFEDMMDEAFSRFGFSVDNASLMIEAIPLSGDSIVLIISRVDNIEEMDSRFARFTMDDGDDETMPSSSGTLSGLDEIFRLLSQISSSARSGSSQDNDSSGPIRPLTDGLPARNGKTGAGEGQDVSVGTTDADGNGSGKSLPSVKRSKRSGSEKQEAAADSKKETSLTRFYLFRDLESAIRASKAANGDYTGWNALYKNPDDSNFYFILRMDDTSAESFNRLCNIFSEYGVAVDYTSGIEDFFREHMQVISEGSAVRTLRSLG